MRHAPARPVPPAPLKSAPRILLAHLWQALPQPHRDRTLLLLSRVVAQQLPGRPVNKEVDHDQS